MSSSSSLSAAGAERDLRVMGAARYKALQAQREAMAASLSARDHSGGVPMSAVVAGSGVARGASGGGGGVEQVPGTAALYSALTSATGVPARLVQASAAAYSDGVEEGDPTPGGGLASPQSLRLAERLRRAAQQRASDLGGGETPRGEGGGATSSSSSSRAPPPPPPHRVLSQLALSAPDVALARALGATAHAVSPLLEPVLQGARVELVGYTGESLLVRAAAPPPLAGDGAASAAAWSSVDAVALATLPPALLLPVLETLTALPVPTRAEPHPDLDLVPFGPPLQHEHAPHRHSRHAPSTPPHSSVAAPGGSPHRVQPPLPARRPFVRLLRHSGAHVQVRTAAAAAGGSGSGIAGCVLSWVVADAYGSGEAIASSVTGEVPIYSLTCIDVPALLSSGTGGSGVAAPAHTRSASHPFPLTLTFQVALPLALLFDAADTAAAAAASGGGAAPPPSPPSALAALGIMLRATPQAAFARLAPALSGAGSGVEGANTTAASAVAAGAATAAAAALGDGSATHLLTIIRLTLAFEGSSARDAWASGLHVLHSLAPPPPGALIVLPTSVLTPLVMGGGEEGGHGVGAPGAPLPHRFDGGGGGGDVLEARAEGSIAAALSAVNEASRAVAEAARLRAVPQPPAQTVAAVAAVAPVRRAQPHMSSTATVPLSTVRLQQPPSARAAQLLAATAAGQVVWSNNAPSAGVAAPVAPSLSSKVTPSWLQVPPSLGGSSSSSSSSSNARGALTAVASQFGLGAPLDSHVARLEELLSASAASAVGGGRGRGATAFTPATASQRPGLTHHSEPFALAPPSLGGGGGAAVAPTYRPQLLTPLASGGSPSRSMIPSEEDGALAVMRARRAVERATASSASIAAAIAGRASSSVR